MVKRLTPLVAASWRAPLAPVLPLVDPEPPGPTTTGGESVRSLLDISSEFVGKGLSGGVVRSSEEFELGIVVSVDSVGDLCCVSVSHQLRVYVSVMDVLLQACPYGKIKSRYPAEVTLDGLEG